MTLLKDLQEKVHNEILFEKKTYRSLLNDFGSEMKNYNQHNNNNSVVFCMYYV